MKIEGTNLVKRYRGRTVVRGVSFEVSQGEIVGLLGPNGAGKTTTFYMVTGLVKPNGGKVTLDGKDISKMPMYQRARHGIGYLPQEASVFRKLTVRDNLKLVLEVAGKKGKEIDATIKRLAEHLHITKLLDQQGGVLSGGERRRVEIARALATNPNFILLDEPFTGIDPVTIEEIQSIIFELKNQGIGILITDHNVAATLRITDRNYILVDGEIIARGSGREIANDDGVRRHYLGEQFGTDAWKREDLDKPEEPEPPNEED